MVWVALRQLGVLLWKNWLIRKRNCLTTFFELFFPLFSVFVSIGLNSIQYEGALRMIQEGPILYPKPVEEIGTNTKLFPDVVLNFIDRLPDLSDWKNVKLNETMMNEMKKIKPFYIGFFTEVYLWPQSPFTEKMANALRNLLFLSTVDIRKLAEGSFDLRDFRLTKFIIVNDEAAFRHILAVDALKKHNQVIGVGFNVEASGESESTTQIISTPIFDNVTESISNITSEPPPPAVSFRKTPRVVIPTSNFEYKFITPNCYKSYHLDEQYRFKADPRPYNVTAYKNCFLVPLQIGVNEAYLNLLAEQKGVERQRFDFVRVKKLPYPRYWTTEKPQSFGPLTIISVMLILFYIMMPIMIVSRVTSEKRSHMRELFRMMGMSDWVFWISHFINYFVVVCFQTLLMTIFYRINIAGHPMIAYSHIGTFFLAMVLWGTANILLSFVVAIVFFRPAIAIVAIIIIWEITFAMPNMILNPMMEKTSASLEPYRIASAFLPNMAITWLLQLMGEREKFGHGVKWNTMFDQVTIFGSLTFGLVLVCLSITCLFLAFLVWYLDNVWPWQEGIPKPVYFFFMPSYWRPRQSLDAEGDAIDEAAVDKHYFEDEPDYEAGISVRKVHKKFADKTVVESVSFNCYRSQITVLLGHNGAGKTTTMNIITGIYPPTKGAAFVDGYNVIEQTRLARKSLGLCPQINIFYNKLTIFEHFRLFAVLRGKTFKEANAEAEQVIDMLQLRKRKDTIAQNLSGGMKRRVCLGNALIGDTKILVLDEPTSGMDPEARRAVWDLLLRIRENKTILITTHHMEEVDVLGNRIAIMADGRVICCGTPLFLKREFGIGSHLRMATDENEFRIHTIRDLLKKYLERVTLESESPNEVVWLIHADSNKQDKSNLIQLFEDLEQNKERLGITSFGMQVTTMEEVFLKVGEVVSMRNSDTDSIGSRFNVAVAQERPYEKLTGFRLWLERVGALLAKRFQYLKRSWPILTFQFILPIVLFSLIFYLDKLARGFKTINVLRQMDFESIYQPKNWYNIKNFLSTDAVQGFYAGEYLPLGRYYHAVAQEEGLITGTIPVGSENAYSLNVTDDLDIYKRKFLFGATANQPTPETPHRNLTIWFQNDAYHSLPASVNLAYKALQNQILGSPGQGKITFWFNSVPRGDLYAYAKELSIGWIITSFVLIPLCISFVVASYTMFVIHENATKAKLLQRMTGTGAFTFWFSHYLFDMLIHFTLVNLILIAFALFDWNQVYMRLGVIIFCAFLLLLLLGLATIPLAYIASFLFDDVAAGFAVSLVFVVIFALALPGITAALFYLHFFIHATVYVYHLLLWTCKFCPIFAFVWGMQKLYFFSGFYQFCQKAKHDNMLEDLCRMLKRKLKIIDYKQFAYSRMKGCCQELCGKKCYRRWEPLAFDDYGIASEVCYLLFSAALFFTLLYFMEKGFLHKASVLFKRNFTTSDVAKEDGDVTRERTRIQAQFDASQITDAIAVIDLTKAFGTFMAVNHLTFGVRKSECFGLLGVNGAGKTTTFRMLTGDLPPDEGDAQIANLKLSEDLSRFQTKIGYCPQFDALLDKLTGEEMLQLFARLRGMPESVIKENVGALIIMSGLEAHFKKRTETYSGGNKRKLSIGMAIIASPQVVFLDEPTAGVDPVSRRKIWSLLRHVKERYECSLVLTSHVMEECEALCARIAIMVNGEFKCLGSTQHLRYKFAQGFTIVLKFKRSRLTEKEYVANVQEYINFKFPFAQVKDYHDVIMNYYIDDTSLLWSQLFRFMEKAKTDLDLEDYQVCDTSLEQIFLTFAREQRETTNL